MYAVVYKEPIEVQQLEWQSRKTVGDEDVKLQKNTIQLQIKILQSQEFKV